MALYDNQHWLLSHIRHSYISSDDTGFSEIIMLGDDLRSPTMECFPGLEDDEEDEEGDLLSQSYDIQSDLDFGAHRQRSNTAQRLEKMEREREKASKVKHIKWEDPQRTLTDEERSDLFERKPIEQTSITRTSFLTQKLKSSPDVPANPYLEFAKFDGCGQVGTSIRRYAIFITILPPEEKDYPLHVTIISSATVQQLIGLTLWKCTTEKNLQIMEDTDEYCLCIAEDDGEVDWDFPCLDPIEAVSKFGFNYLALVKSGVNKNEKHNMSMPFTSLKTGPSLADRDELEIGGALDQAMKSLVQQQEAEQRMKGHMTAMEAPLYQLYSAYMLNKVRARCPVHIGISGEKIEIDPIAYNKQTTRFWAKCKASQYDMNCIAACEVANDKRSSKIGFRLVYQVLDEENTFKTIDFEAETSVAQEIIQKINYLLELIPGNARRQYIELKEKKYRRRRSFNLGGIF